MKQGRAAGPNCLEATRDGARDGGRVGDLLAMGTAGLGDLGEVHGRRIGSAEVAPGFRLTRRGLREATAHALRSLRYAVAATALARSFKPATETTQAAAPAGSSPY